MTSTQRLLPAAAALLSLTSAFAASAQAPPTVTEQRIIASIDRNAEANVELLRRLVEINSGTMNIAGVEAVAALLKPRFEALGFTVRTVDQTEVKRAPHLVAMPPLPFVQSGRRLRQAHPAYRPHGHGLRQGQPLPALEPFRPMA